MIVTEDSVQAFILDKYNIDIYEAPERGQRLKLRLFTSTAHVLLLECSGETPFEIGLMFHYHTDTSSAIRYFYKRLKYEYYFRMKALRIFHAFGVNPGFRVPEGRGSRCIN